MGLKGLRGITDVCQSSLKQDKDPPHIDDLSWAVFDYLCSKFFKNGWSWGWCDFKSCTNHNKQIAEKTPIKNLGEHFCLSQGWIKSRLPVLFRTDSFKTKKDSQTVSEFFYFWYSFEPNRCRKLWRRGNKSTHTHTSVSFICKAQCESMIFFTIALKMLTLCFDRQFWRFFGWLGQTVSKYPKFQGRQFQIFLDICIFTPGLSVSSYCIFFTEVHITGCNNHGRGWRGGSGARDH